MPDPLAPCIAAVLADESSALRTEAARRYVDQLLAQRLRDVVELDGLIALVLQTTSQSNLTRSVERHVRPGYERVIAQLVGEDARVADLLSDEALSALRAAIASEQSQLVRGRWLRGALDPQLLQRLLGPIVVQLLVSFAKRLGLSASSPNAAPGQVRSGLAGRIGRGMQQGAERLVGAGRSALEGLGIDLETKLTAAARDFSESVLGQWNKALHERLTSPDGRAIVQQIRLGVLEHVLRTKLRDLHEDAVGIGRMPYLELAPLIIASAVERPFVRGRVAAEIRAFVTLEGERSLGELLREHGIFDEVYAWLVQRADSALAAFVRDPEFAAWLGRLLEAARARE